MRIEAPNDYREKTTYFQNQGGSVVISELPAGYLHGSGTGLGGEASVWLLLVPRVAPLFRGTRKLRLKNGSNENEYACFRSAPRARSRRLALQTPITRGFLLHTTENGPRQVKNPAGAISP